ncbi:MAG: hypothetical protein NVSMB56_08500 [Pyrinomonadaceae bacterium]
MSALNIDRRSSPKQPPQVSEVFANLLRHPSRVIGRHWNWKAAVLSSIIRATLFFATTISAGAKAAMAATVIEFIFRAVVSGVFGALIEAFCRAEPAWASILTIGLIIPVIAQVLELLVHWLYGTPNLRTGIIVSTAFTALASVFNLFAMRRGALIIGDERGSLFDDLRRMPVIFFEFIAIVPLTLWRFIRK